MILRLPLPLAPPWIGIAVVFGLVGGCGGGRQRPPATPREVPVDVAAAPARDSVQALYESGRYREVLNNIGVGDAGPAALWFAAHSSLRLGQHEEAVRQFARLPTVGMSAAWRVVSELALARVEGDPEAIDRVRTRPTALPLDPFVQFELGLAHASRDDFAAAAVAFDRCTEADRRFAYAYYYAGLAYNRLNRPDLMAARFELFQRLAPEAPERPEVESILRTVRGR